VITRLRVERASFAAAPAGPSVAAAGRPAYGTRVSYRVSAAATVRFTVQRIRPGRRRGSGSAVRCVTPTRLNRSARACTRDVPLAGGFTRAAGRASDSFRFSGRLRARRLPRGVYRLVATPAASGRVGRPVSRIFRIIR
jgi:hypothetical protein